MADVRRVGVLGCGLMGSGIAEISAKAGLETWVREVNDQLVEKGRASITKSLEPGPVTQGSDVTFTLTVMNAGPDAASNVVVTDTLPPQLTFVSATPSTGSCSGTVTITCNLGTLNPAGSETITIVATMNGTGPTTNVAAVASDTADGDGTDNTGQVTFTILPAVFEAIPALDPRMQLLLAALVAAAAMGILKRS